MEKLINETMDFVRKRLQGEASGHDWWHTHRVWKNSIQIGQGEQVDMLVVQLAALLHDIADWKLHNGDIMAGPLAAREFLTTRAVGAHTTAHVCDIIEKISFKGAKVARPELTKEGQVVQDADRLDAIGAIGIARAFAYGGYKNRELYNPEIVPAVHETFEQYKNNASPSINHFYEKLLLLKDLMNTDTAKKMASKRHAFMEHYLSEFFYEVGPC